VVQTQTTTAPTSTTTAPPNPGVALGAAAAKKDESDSESEGLPGWAWGLIGLAVGGGVVWAVAAYRRRHAPAGGASDGSGPPGTAPPSP
jgi:hypothetical protein